MANVHRNWWHHGFVEAKRLWQVGRNGIDNETGAAPAINGAPLIEGEEAANATAPEAGPVATTAE
jgi:hypothetical protein